MRIYLDIETLPSLHPEAREQARKNIKPPGTLKKPESIAAWWTNEAPDAVEEAYRKQALDGAAGELCALGFATDTLDPVSLVRALDEPERVFILRSLDAIQALLHANPILSATGRDAEHAIPYFVCHNAPFDIGFLMRRCWVHGIQPAFKLPSPAARDGKDYGDTMTAWAGYRNTISLDRLCVALGVPSPKQDGVDGSQVFDLWQSGKHDDLARYNAGDVSATRSCWLRLNFEAQRGKAEPVGGTVPAIASTTPTPEEKRAAVVEAQDVIAAFMNSRDFGKEPSKIRAILVEFVKFQAERGLKMAA